MKISLTSKSFLSSNNNKENLKDLDFFWEHKKCCKLVSMAKVLHQDQNFKRYFNSNNLIIDQLITP